MTREDFDDLCKSEPAAVPPVRTMEIYFLDVGQGDATLIMPPVGEGDPILFDCKDDHVVLRTLEAKGITRLEAVVLSHLDWDHIAGTMGVLDGVEVGCVYYSFDRKELKDSDDKNKGAKELLDHIQGGKWETVAATRDRRAISAKLDWSIHLVAPHHHEGPQAVARTGHYEEPNRYSAVLRVAMAGQVVLIGGDAPMATWAKVPNAERSAQVFRIPHHGGGIDDGGIPAGWDPTRLYQEVGAPVAVVSVGSNNGYEHPDPQWMGPICGGACRMMCTQVTPRCQPDVNSGGRTKKLVENLGTRVFAEPLWRHYKDADRTDPNGARKAFEVPCAGTVVVSLEAGRPPEVLPSATDHAAVVRNWATPLCLPKAPAAPPAPP
jgi:beta-lactamase superfamily II metal-dependent hydrolase